VRRGAKASRATQTNPYLVRAPKAGRIVQRQPLRPQDNLLNPESRRSPCVHLECRLPINLREFLADQLGAVVDESDTTVLNLAADADELTLSKLARAIRRYSTNRARQRWDECSVPLKTLTADGQDAVGILCLRCQAVDLNPGAAQRHRPPGCIVLNLSGPSSAPVSTRGPEAAVADSIRNQIEEFRRLRAAFGLPHFELDSYVRHDCITFTWRPVS
jgi:hypothetical protein